MSASDIQTFLSGKGSGLASRSFTLNCYGADSKERQWYTAVGAPCDQTVPASQIIYYAAQIYGINPQVILATLQKEQSLITSPNPTDWQVNQAMGYGCPTTGGCGASNFFYQIDSGVWVLRFHYERARGNMTWWRSDTSWVCGTEKNFYKPNLLPNQDVRFYDEDGVHYRTHFIANAATSSLYCYTPHAYNNPQGLSGLPTYGTSGRYYTGSYNFVYSFERWFGSTTGLPPYLNIPHPDGTLVRPAAGPNVSRVYLLKNGGAAYATSLGVFQSWGFDFGRVKIATQGDLNLMAAHDADTTRSSTPAPLQFREGTLVKGSGPTVYVIQNVSGVNRKRSLDNQENFVRLGYSPNDVIEIPDSELSQIPEDAAFTMATPTHPNGTMIRNTNDPTVYYIINGERHSMTSGTIFYSHGFKWENVKTATAGDNQLPITWPVTWYGEGTLLKGAGPTVYIVDLDVSGVNMSKRNFVTYYNFVGLDYRFGEVRLIGDSELPSQNGPNIGL